MTAQNQQVTTNKGETKQNKLTSKTNKQNKQTSKQTKALEAYKVSCWYFVTLYIILCSYWCWDLLLVLQCFINIA